MHQSKYSGVPARWAAARPFHMYKSQLPGGNMLSSKCNELDEPGVLNHRIESRPREQGNNLFILDLGPQRHWSSSAEPLLAAVA